MGDAGLGPWQGHKAGCFAIGSTEYHYGEYAKGSYPYRKMRDAGIPLAFSTDYASNTEALSWPTEIMQVAINGDGNLYHQPLTMRDMIEGFTTGGYATTREANVGKLHIGYKADMVVYEKDLCSVPPAELSKDNPRVLSTWIAGRRSFIEIRLGFHTDRSVSEMMNTVHHLKTGLESDIPGVEVTVVPVQAERLFDGHAAKTAIRIVPLSPATLRQALDLISTTLSLTPDEVPTLELEEAVEPGRHTAALAEKGISDPCYWVALYHGHVAGVIGIFSAPWTVTRRSGAAGPSMIPN